MAGDGDVKLLGWLASPFVIRVRIALDMKGVRYECIEDDFFNKSPLPLASNPVHRKVPVLIHNGKPVRESLLIMQYIDGVWGGAARPPILPADPYRRATALFWAAYVDAKLHPAWLGLVKASTEKASSEKIKETLAAVRLLEGALAHCANGKKKAPFFGGDSIGLLDIAAGSHVVLLQALGKMCGVELVDAGRAPLVAAWAARFGEAAAAKDVVPEVSRAVEHLRKLQTGLAAARAAKL